MLREIYPNLHGGITNADCDDILEEEQNAEAKKSLKDFELPSYKISKSSKISSLIKLLHNKSMTVGVINHLPC